MQVSFSGKTQTIKGLEMIKGLEDLKERILRGLMASVIGLVLLYISLVTTSQPVTLYERVDLDAAISLLDRRGFNSEVFLLSNTATFRRSDHWLNKLAIAEPAFASTNFPFQIVTIYPDFFDTASDDTERAMILLHEARHLAGDGEAEAYTFVWNNRARLGWTEESHGDTPLYAMVTEQTRAYAPKLFTVDGNTE
jgi:hypothetical protein